MVTRGVGAVFGFEVNQKSGKFRYSVFNISGVDPRLVEALTRCYILLGAVTINPSAHLPLLVCHQFLGRALFIIHHRGRGEGGCGGRACALTC